MFVSKKRKALCVVVHLKCRITPVCVLLYNELLEHSCTLALFCCFQGPLSRTGSYKVIVSRAGPGGEQEEGGLVASVLTLPCVAVPGLVLAATARHAGAVRQHFPGHHVLQATDIVVGPAGCLSGSKRANYL